MTVGIVGLGLIGGSFAKAYKAAGHRVLAYNRTKSVEEFALLAGDVDGPLTPETAGECELIIISLYPEATVRYLEVHGAEINKNATIIDACGAKRYVCRECFRIAKQHGFTFVGGHPMAGTHFSGYKYSRANMFSGAPMVLVPEKTDSIELLARVKALLEPCGFGRITVTTPEIHDKMIAFTSQLAHIVSSAYIKSPTALSHKGFSAGSYRDLTRVAWLNPDMWTELFLENGDNLLNELDNIIGALSDYREAIANNDKEKLRALLQRGKELKEEVDGR